MVECDSTAMTPILKTKPSIRGLNTPTGARSKSGMGTGLARSATISTPQKSSSSTSTGSSTNISTRGSPGRGAKLTVRIEDDMTSYAQLIKSAPVKTVRRLPVPPMPATAVEGPGFGSVSLLSVASRSEYADANANTDLYSAPASLQSPTALTSTPRTMRPRPLPPCPRPRLRPPLPPPPYTPNANLNANEPARSDLRDPAPTTLTPSSDTASRSLEGSPPPPEGLARRVVKPLPVPAPVLVPGVAKPEPTVPPNTNRNVEVSSHPMPSQPSSSPLLPPSLPPSLPLSAPSTPTPKPKPTSTSTRPTSNTHRRAADPVPILVPVLVQEKNKHKASLSLSEEIQKQLPWLPISRPVSRAISKAESKRGSKRESKREQEHEGEREPDVIHLQFRHSHSHSHRHTLSLDSDTSTSTSEDDYHYDEYDEEEDGDGYSSEGGEPTFRHSRVTIRLDLANSNVHFDSSPSSGVHEKDVIKSSDLEGPARPAFKFVASDAKHPDLDPHPNLDPDLENFVDYSWMLENRKLYRLDAHALAAHQMAGGKWLCEKKGRRVTERDWENVLQMLRTL